jgi:hypothetical protein
MGRVFKIDEKIKIGRITGSKGDGPFLLCAQRETYFCKNRGDRVMTYSRFEDLPVWQEAIRLAEDVYSMTERRELRWSNSVRDQLERAALSVSNNIAEGFERGTTNELLRFSISRRFSR